MTSPVFQVSVAIVDLKPTFEYECVPKRTNHAYLKAKVKNTSPYALLAGPTNIFLDNNFIAKVTGAHVPSNRVVKSKANSAQRERSGNDFNAVTP